MCKLINDKRVIKKVQTLGCWLFLVSGDQKSGDREAQKSSQTCLWSPERDLQLNSNQCKMEPSRSRANIPPTQVGAPPSPSGNEAATALTLVHTNRVSVKFWAQHCLILVVDITHKKRAQYQILKPCLMPQGHISNQGLLTKRATRILATSKKQPSNLIQK